MCRVDGIVFFNGNFSVDYDDLRGGGGYLFPKDCILYQYIPNTDPEEWKIVWEPESEKGK